MSIEREEGLWVFAESEKVAAICLSQDIVKEEAQIRNGVEWIGKLSTLWILGVPIFLIMASSDEESSHSDFEDDFDMESIRRACQITGTSPSDLRSRPPPSGNVSLGSDSDGDDEDELALVRSIHQRFADSSVEEPLTLKPLRTKLPDSLDTDDSDDDYEALRAIQKRFASTGGTWF